MQQHTQHMLWLKLHDSSTHRRREELRKVFVDNIEIRSGRWVDAIEAHILSINM